MSRQTAEQVTLTSCEDCGCKSSLANRKMGDFMSLPRKKNRLSLPTRSRSIAEREPNWRTTLRERPAIGRQSIDPMKITRRSALQRTAAFSAGAAFSALSSVRAADASGRKLRVAVIGLGRGMGHVQALLSLSDVEITYLAEVDPKRLEHGLKAVTEKQKTRC